MSIADLVVHMWGAVTEFGEEVQVTAEEDSQDQGAKVAAVVVEV